MQTLLADSKTRSALFIAGGVLIFLTAITSLNAVVLNPDLVLWLYDVTLVIAATACAVLSFMLMSSFKGGEVNERIWMALSIAFALWAAAELIFVSYELFGFTRPPSVSLADFAWVIGYVPFFFALYLRYQSLRADLSLIQWIGVLIVFAILAGLSWNYLIYPIFQTITDWLELTLYVAYPIGDLLLALGAVLVVLALTGGEMSIPWLIIAFAFLVLVFADSLYYYADSAGLYIKNQADLLTTVVDVLYAGSYVVLAFGIYVQGRIQRAF
jgi:hypothetical protein